MPTWNVLEVLNWTAKRFDDAGFSSGRLEAQVLLAHVLACSRTQLYMNFDKPLAEAELARYRELIRRRLAGEPAAYLVGDQEFWSRSFLVTKDVLIPRPDTETLIELALTEAKRREGSLKICDVCAGSGAIAVTLAKELPQANVVATELSTKAAAVARDNVARHDVGDRVRVVEGDLMTPAVDLGPFDLIVSNPPYVRRGDIAGLSAEVRHEPAMALDGGDDGLELVRRLIPAAHDSLVPGGYFAAEHGFDQGDAVATLMRQAGFERVEIHRDLAGHQRITSGYLTSR